MNKYFIRFLNGILFGICTALSVALFWRLGNSIAESAIFGVLALAFECTKMHDLIQWRKRRRSVHGYSFLIKAMLSVFCSFAFALVTIDTKIAKSTDHVLVRNENLSFQEGQISDLDERIEIEKDAISIKLKNLGELDPTWITASQRLTDQIEIHRNVLEDLISEKNSIMRTGLQERLLESDSISDEDIFSIMAERFEIGVDVLLIIILLIIVVLLEISVATTTKEIITSSIVINEEPLNFQEKVLHYTNALFKGKSKPGQRLNSLQSIAINTQLKHSEIRKITEYLKSLKFKGQPILVSVKGKTHSPFSHQNFQKIVTFKLQNKTRA